METVRREATAKEAKALGHPLRLRILRLCMQQELTNKQLADRLGRDPGTVLYHVRLLTDAGLLDQAEVRTGESGALEKPYRSSGKTWWLDSPLAGQDADVRFAPIQAFQEELREAGPESVQFFERFALHLSPEAAAELDRRIWQILDEYVATDPDREDQPLLSGLFILHRSAPSADLAGRSVLRGKKGVKNDRFSSIEHGSSVIPGRRGNCRGRMIATYLP